MYKLASKSNYKTRFIGYSTLTALVLILDGIITFFVGPFGYSSNVYGDFCEWNLRKDMKRMKATREASKERMRLNMIVSNGVINDTWTKPECDYPGISSKDNPTSEDI